MMLKLKGQTGSGEWVVFSVSDIEDADRDYTEVRLLNGDNINYILTSTIQLAEDPRKQMLDEIRDTLKINLKNMDYEEWVEDLFYEILDEQEAKL